ncbi:MAG TPA: polysaccharide deacetylase family protein [Terriglobales bacterium]|nr:polysaccharide deacetylase family protein [Terriglobales bacterium]
MGVGESWYSNPLYVRAKQWLFEFLFRSGLLSFFRFLRRHSVLVAIYHDVLPPGFPEVNPLFGMTVSVEEFAWQIQYFKKHYNPISFQQFSDWYFRGQSLPPRPVLITFDDGHANNLRFALPILQQERVTAICFVLTGELGSSRQTWFEDAYYRLMFSKVQSWRLRNGECRPLETSEQRAAACGRFFSLCRTLSEAEQKQELESLQSQLPVQPRDGELGGRFDFLSQEDIRRLSESGIEIGSHTITHPILGALKPENARSEIADSKSALERLLGKPVRTFAYPFGAPGLDFTPRDEALVEESGYALAFAGEGGFVTRSSKQFALPRVGIGRMTRAHFAATVAGAVDSLKRVLAAGTRGE